MAQANNLALSGLLHDDNFAEWKVAMDATLKEYWCDAYLSSSPPKPQSDQEDSATPRSQDDSDSEDELAHGKGDVRRDGPPFFEGPRFAFDLILHRLSPDIVRMLKQDVLVSLDPHMLWIALDRLLLPFPVLDLPDSVRNRIWNIVIAMMKKDLSPGDLYGSPVSIALPPLTLVSKQVRSEVLSLWVSQSTFKLHLNPDILVSTRLHVEDWADNVSNYGTEHLRSISLRFTRPREKRHNFVYVLNFTFDRPNGLITVRGSTYDREELATAAIVEGRKRLVGHLQAVKRTCKLAGPHSNPLLLIICSDLSIWDSSSPVFNSANFSKKIEFE